MPKITVLMPVYNAAPFIRAAVDSVLEQTFHDFEFLIINDGSTDLTKEIIESYSDPRIRLMTQDHKGVAGALNSGLRESRAEYIARFDADDICFPYRLEKQVAYMEANRDYILTGGEAEYIDINGEHLFHFKCIGYSHEDIIGKIKDNCPFIHTTVMYRKDAVLQVGGYPAGAHNFEDHLLWVKMNRLGKYFNLPIQLVKVRVNPTSVTIDEKWRGRNFRRLKSRILNRGEVLQEEEKKLISILEKQDKEKIKRGAYYALCGKKFLLDNHEPVKARKHLAKAIRTYPLRVDTYILFVLSWFPASFLKWLHSVQGKM